MLPDDAYVLRSSLSLPAQRLFPSNLLRIHLRLLADDPQNMVRDGFETIPLALQLLGPYVAHCHIGAHEPTRGELDENGQRQWVWRRTGMGEGLYDIPMMIKCLKVIALSVSCVCVSLSLSLLVSVSLWPPPSSLPLPPRAHSSTLCYPCRTWTTTVSSPWRISGALMLAAPSRQRRRRLRVSHTSSASRGRRMQHRSSRTRVSMEKLCLTGSSAQSWQRLPAAAPASCLWARGPAIPAR